MGTVIRDEDSLRPLFRLLVGLGVVALVIFALGLITILAFAPPGQKTGLKARVSGVYPYDPSSQQVTGPPSQHFRPDQAFAARVDWSSLPPAAIVGARWYNTLGQPVGAVGPAPAGTLASQEAPVPVRTPPELHRNLPGSYVLTVVRYSGGRPVELLARTNVLVERNG